MHDVDEARRSKHITHSSPASSVSSVCENEAPLAGLGSVFNSAGRRSSGVMQNSLCPPGFRFQCSPGEAPGLGREAEEARWEEARGEFVEDLEVVEDGRLSSSSLSNSPELVLLMVSLSSSNQAPWKSFSLDVLMSTLLCNPLIPTWGVRRA